MSHSENNTNNSIPSDILSTCFDVIIIGAGVVGCAMARRFTLEGARVLLVEKSGDILDGASKGNSAILHTGFDAKPGSVEQACIQTGYEEYLSIRSQLGLPILETGALVVAWSSQEQDKLDGILNQARLNGVEDARLLTRDQIITKEPGIAKAAIAAIEIPGESLIDPWTTPHVYLLQALENGAALLRHAEVTAGDFEGAEWRLKTTRGLLKAKTVINCGGLYGDNLDRLLLGKSAFEIRPRKGQFLLFDKSAGDLVHSIILPVPDEITKGIVVCKTIFGNLLVGPTAQEQQSRDDASVDKNTLEILYKRGIEIIPELANQPVTATYAGIRPATEHKDYCIQAHGDKNYICVGGIRSTGLSAAPGIATYVYDLYLESGNRHKAKLEFGTPRLAQLAEHNERDWCKPGNGGIVCHCELVTRREIENALRGPLAATSLSALKRRTRVTMGRCQGFYCTALLSEMTDDYFELPIGIDDVKS